MGGISLVGLFGPAPLAPFGENTFCCFLIRGVLCGAMLGCLVADWKCRHIGETERRAAEAAALYTADISCRRAAVGESNDYDEVKTSQQAHVEGGGAASPALAPTRCALAASSARSDAPSCTLRLQLCEPKHQVQVPASCLHYVLPQRGDIDCAILWKLAQHLLLLQSVRTANHLRSAFYRVPYRTVNKPNKQTHDCHDCHDCHAHARPR